MGHILNLACQGFLFAKDNEAVEMAIRDAEEMQREDERLGLEEGRLRATESEYTQSEASQEEWRKIGAMGKLHNIAVWLRRSPTRYQRFQKHARRILPRDNDTRWNSWLTMLEAAVDMEYHIRVFIEKHWDEMEKNHLDSDD